MNHFAIQFFPRFGRWLARLPARLFKISEMLEIAFHACIERIVLPAPVFIFNEIDRLPFFEYLFFVFQAFR